MEKLLNKRITIIFIIILSGLLSSFCFIYLLNNLISQTIPGIETFSEFPEVVSKLKFAAFSNICCNIFIIATFILITILGVRHCLRLNSNQLCTSLSFSFRNFNIKKFLFFLAFSMLSALLIFVHIVILIDIPAIIDSGFKFIMLYLIMFICYYLNYFSFIVLSLVEINKTT